MKLIERSPVNQKHIFRVLKFFFYKEVVQSVGVEVEIDLPQVEIDSLVKARKVYPCDLQDGLTYVVVQPFSLPGQAKKHDAERMDLVSLKAGDALPLMLERKIVPRDDGQYRPYGMKLGTPPEPNYKFRDVVDRADQKIFENEFKQKFKKE